MPLHRAHDKLWTPYARKRSSTAGPVVTGSIQRGKQPLMSMTKKLLTIAATGAVAISLAACSSATGGNASGAGANASDCNVGISMPTRSLERWINDGEQLQKQLKDAGCTVDLQYADNKTDQQISQIQNQVAGGSKILVIAAIDGKALAPVLDEAKKQKATVIAYDRLINGTKNVDYYATFDNYKVGQLQGQFIVDKLGLKDGKGPFNLEPFAGSPDDNNAKFFFSGAWDVLLPYIQSGKLVVPSGKAPKSNDGWASIGIQGWASDKAQAEMDNRLSSFYSGGSKVNVVLSPNDSLAVGIEASLKSAGYAPGADYPIITGQDADKANVKAILAGEQSMTVWKDTRALGTQVFSMIQDVAAGKTPKVNDTKTYNNGEKVVPSYLLDPEVVVKDDVKTKLVDSGFIKASDVGL
jgi:putative multiple sugar transport system substrate-binding protein